MSIRRTKAHGCPARPARQARWLGLAFVLVIGTGPAAAAEPRPWNGQAITNVMRFDAMAVGDVEGHQVALYENQGAVIQEDGEVGLLTIRGTVELEGPKGTYRGYLVIEYQDGARALADVEGTLEVGTDEPTDRGALTFTGGTGRLQGLSGQGTYEGRMLTPLDERGTTHYTWTATVSLPE